MSAARFKSNDDYFSKRSGLARQVIEKKPQKRQKKSLDTSIPVSIMSEIFCQTIDRFEISDKGRFETGEYSLDEALIQHLAGGESIKINPLSQSGEAEWNVVHFALSGKMDHPFTKAKQFSEKLLSFGIQSYIEVAGRGKGDYHLWIFHEKPVNGRAVAEALNRLGLKLFGIDLEMAPSMEGAQYIPLPLQGESILFQRCVFVNSVGKMIRNQRSFLLNIERTPGEAVEAFLEEMQVDITKTPVDKTHMTRFPDMVKKTAKPSGQPVKSPSKETAAQDEKPVKRAAGTPSSHKKIVQKTTLTGQTTIDKVPEISRVVLFTVNGNVYGLDAGSVDSVQMSGSMSAIHCPETPLSGSIQANGKILPVIDAGFLFEGVVKTQSPGSRILIIKGTSGFAGLLVDGTSGIRKVQSVTGKPSGGEVPAREFVVSGVDVDGYKESIPWIDHEKIVAYTNAENNDNERPGAEKDTHLVIFRTGDVVYGFPADSVHEILVLSDMHSIQGPDGLSRRAVRYGKSYIPLIDIRERSSIQADSVLNGEKGGRLLVISGKESLAGVIADNIEGIRAFSRDELLPAPASMRQKTYVSSFTREHHSDSIVLVCDPLLFVEKHG